MLASNVVGYLLRHPFASLSAANSTEIKRLGRPCPPLDIITSYKNKKSGKIDTRKFKSDYYLRYLWLCGCPHSNKLFCYPCLLFSKSKNAWTSYGYNKLNNLCKDAKRHENSIEHKINWKTWKRYGKQQHIDVALSRARADEIERHNESVKSNRKVLEAVIDCTLFLAIHDLAFRGHDESTTSLNRGNFKDLLELRAKDNLSLKAHMESATIWRGDSKTTQNELIRCIAEEIHAVICSEIQDTDFIAIEADETTDSSSQSQMTFVVRYVRHHVPVERFICFRNISGDASADVISQHILSSITDVRKGKNSPVVVAQTYDGASTMAGRITGVQKKVRDVHPTACFIHCYAHRLNLVLQNCVGHIKYANVFFSTIDGLHTFFRLSPKRTAALEEVANKKIGVSAASKTRWTYKSRALKQLKSDFAIFVTFFDRVADDTQRWDGNTRIMAAGFVSSLSKIDFIFHLVALERVFTLCQTLFKQLEKIQQTVVSAKQRLDNVMSSLINMRSEGTFRDVWLDVEKLKDIFVDVKVTVRANRREVGADDAADQTPNYKDQFYRIIDCVMHHFNVRFCDLGSLAFVSALDITKFPQYEVDFPSKLFDCLVTSPYAELFIIKELRDELRELYRDSLTTENVQSLSDILKNIEDQGIEDSYKQVSRILKLILTLPISSSSAERSFSCMKRIKCYLRTTMSDERLSHLALVSIERDLAGSVDRESVIDRYARSGTRRIELLLK